MPTDPFQIALEHHRAGRMRQAEAGYRDALAATPNHANASHWLGVLLTQANRPADAIPLLQRAVELNPDDAAFQHNLGQAYLAAGRLPEAIGALTESAALDPERAETFLALARVYALRRSGRDAHAAVAALRRAREQGIDTPELHHDLGVALLASGQSAEALQSLATAIAARPDYAPAYFQTAMAHRAQGDRKAARNWLNKALEIDREYGQAWHALGAIDAETGNFQLAIGHFRRAIKYRPELLAAHRALADVLSKLGQNVEAAAALQQANAVEELFLRPATEQSPANQSQSPAVAELEDRLTMDSNKARLHEALAAVAGLMSPAQATPEAMAHLFDRYADRFDSHLRDRLGYTVPEQLVDAVQRVRPAAPPADVLDLGCGTGLCGPLLRPLARTLVGVDLSPRMIEKARERNVYDELEVVDLVERLKRSPASADLIVAADVLIYIGDLTPFFEAAVAALRPGGLIAFSVEAADIERYVRNPITRRYTHAKSYIQHMASIFGLTQKSLDAITIRQEKSEPVAGWLVVLEK